jgi:radical SAM superfamily enzyme YgiQ (UPF0313 family)
VKRTVLFINPNRYRHPPTIPLGVEYLTHALTQSGVHACVLDLCFSEDPEGEITAALGDAAYDAVCLTVRNVDTVLYPDTEFFLPEIRDYIRLIKTLARCPVIIGGSALPADPEGILKFLGADIAVTGPGEAALPRLVKGPGLRMRKGEVIRGGPPAGPSSGRRHDFDYSAYFRKDGIAGFETHKGCSSGCVFCTEAGSRVWFRRPEDVVLELKGMAEQGFSHLHLCDSEFNEDTGFSIELLKLMVKERLGIRWALYMKPGSPDSRLFELLSASGAYLVTLSVDTYRRPAGYWRQAKEMARLARENGIRVSMELLAGFPREDEDTLKRGIEFLAGSGADDTMINVYLRLYKTLGITRLIEADPALERHVIGEPAGSYLHPVFYNHIPLERLRELTSGVKNLRIAGAEKGVNYQKANRQKANQ